MNCHTCGKVAHATEGAAYAHLKDLAKKEGSTRLNVYPCPAGLGTFHVGHNTRRMRVDIRNTLRAGNKAVASQRRRRPR